MDGGAYYFHHDTNKNDQDTSSSLAPRGKAIAYFHAIKNIYKLPTMTKEINKEKLLLKPIL